MYWLSFSRILVIRFFLTLYIVTTFSKASPNPTEATTALEEDSETNNETDNHAVIITTESNHTLSLKKGSSNCFPSIGFEMPHEVPKTLTGWWCDWDTEYAFVGFSYEVSECQSLRRLQQDFKDIKQSFRGRYVRIYGACDRPSFYDDVIDAAWQAGIGVHALIWISEEVRLDDFLPGNYLPPRHHLLSPGTNDNGDFQFGFDGNNKWKKRRDDLIFTLYRNNVAKFVVRAIQFGSEPLFDDVLTPNELAEQILETKKKLYLHIPVTVSDLAYSYQKHGGAHSVMSAIDIIDAHMLPFFAQDASTAKNAWPLVTRDLNWFIQNGQGKKIYLSENGWPSETYPGVEPNSEEAVADIQNEHDYYNLLDEHCQYFKTLPGGVGWFAHLYSDSQEPGYGIYDTKGRLKFPFKPRITC